MTAKYDRQCRCECTTVKHKTMTKLAEQQSRPRGVAPQWTHCRCTHMELLYLNGLKHEKEMSKHPCVHICFVVSVHRTCSTSAGKSGFLRDTDEKLSLVRCAIYFYSNTPTEKPNNKFQQCRTGILNIRGKYGCGSKNALQQYYPPNKIVYSVRNTKIALSYCATGGRDSSVGIATRYGPGIGSPWEERFSAPVQTGPGAHPASYTTGTGSFPGVKQSWRGADHPSPSSAEV